MSVKNIKFKSVTDTNELNILSENENILPSDAIASQTVADLENELKKFRLEWKKELEEEKKTDKSEFLSSFNPVESETIKTSKNVGVYHQLPHRNRIQSNKLSDGDNLDSIDLDYRQPRTNEEKAQYLFNKGVILEQQSRHFEAIKFYRMAIQLDADIEFKMVSTKPPKLEAESKSDERDNNEKVKDTILSSELEKPLYQIFKEFIDSGNKLCEKAYPQKVIKLINTKILKSLNSFFLVSSFFRFAF